MLGNLGRLATLTLWDNEIGDIGLSALAPELGKQTQLTYLDLSDNKIGDVGVAALAPQLGKLVGLTLFSLNGNAFIGELGRAALAVEECKILRRHRCHPGFHPEVQKE